MPHVTDWRTPQDWFAALNARCQFTIDAAADHENHLLPRYCTEDGMYNEDGKIGDVKSGLDPVAWMGEVVYCNPPYLNLLPWLELASTGLHDGAVLLLPANLDTKWAHKYVLPQQAVIEPVELSILHDMWRGWYESDRGLMVLFREGRMSFAHPTLPGGAPRYANMLVAIGEPEIVL